MKSKSLFFCTLFKHVFFKINFGWNDQFTKKYIITGLSWQGFYKVNSCHSVLVSFTLGKTWTIPLIKAQSALGWFKKKKKAALSNSFTFPRQQWKRRKYKVSEFPPEKEQLRPTILDQSPTQWLRDRTRTRTRPGPGSNTSILSSGPATPLKTASDWEWTASQWLTSWRSHDRDLENMHEKKEGFVFVCVSVCVSVHAHYSVLILGLCHCDVVSMWAALR